MTIRVIVLLQIKQNKIEKAQMVCWGPHGEPSSSCPSASGRLSVLTFTRKIRISEDQKIHRPVIINSPELFFTPDPGGPMTCGSLFSFQIEVFCFLNLKDERLAHWTQTVGVVNTNYEDTRYPYIPYLIRT